MAKYKTKLPPLDPCPIEHVVGLIGGRWKARLLYEVRSGPISMASLLRAVPRASRQVITAQLTALSADGLIARAPPGAGRLWGAYVLTERGASLCLALDAISDWGREAIGWPRAEWPQSLDLTHPEAAL